jgi:hypothetical protein
LPSAPVALLSKLIPQFAAKLELSNALQVAPYVSHIAACLDTSEADDGNVYPGFESKLNVVLVPSVSRLVRAFLKVFDELLETGITGFTRLIVLVKGLNFVCESSTKALWVASGKLKNPSLYSVL